MRYAVSNPEALRVPAEQIPSAGPRRSADEFLAVDLSPVPNS